MPLDKILKLNTNEEAIFLYGTLDENLKFAEKEFAVRISAANYRLKISGNQENIDKAYDFFHRKLEQYRHIQMPELHHASSKEGKEEKEETKKPAAGKGPGISYFHRGRLISAKSKNQEKYLEAIRSYDIVFGIGPAGTGKTYLAMAAALDQLKKKLVSRIILTRPAVEAGESLGFLPGDFQAKVNPYLRPLYDALHDMMETEEAMRLVERGMIEVAPIAYMRGRTLNDCFVILDEAQNCTHAQMKMFLTRLGQNSKAVITGDITQIDLPGKKSGLIEAQLVLPNIQGIKFILFEEGDVLRHFLVREIVKAYEKYERKISSSAH